MHPADERAVTRGMTAAERRLWLALRRFRPGAHVPLRILAVQVDLPRREVHVLVAELHGRGLLETYRGMPVSPGLA